MGDFNTVCAFKSRKMKKKFLEALKRNEIRHTSFITTAHAHLHYGFGDRNGFFTKFQS